MNMNEKKALYSFGCPNRESTVKRLRMVAALSPNPATKKLFCTLPEQLFCEKYDDKRYRYFFYHLRLETETYFYHKSVLEHIKGGSMEDDYGKADEV